MNEMNPHSVLHNRSRYTFIVCVFIGIWNGGKPNEIHTLLTQLKFVKWYPVIVRRPGFDIVKNFFRREMLSGCLFLYCLEVNFQWKDRGYVSVVELPRFVCGWYNPLATDSAFSCSNYNWKKIIVTSVDSEQLCHDWTPVVLPTLQVAKPWLSLI